QEYLGLIFTYFGDAERGDTGAFRPPPLPRYPFLEDPDPATSVRIVYNDIRPFNYRNRIENSVDPVHVAFVHRNSEYRGLTGCPQVSVEETDYGMEIRALRSNGVRVTHCVMPTGMRIRVAPRTPESGWRDMMLWEVPVDATGH